MMVVIVLPLIIGCAKKDTHWGQNLDVKKWWKKEGQSWDRKTNVFMTIGYSNPDWTEKTDMRKSADLDARSQVASFMQSLVKNYMEEIRSHSYAISESAVKSSANETVLGSVIADRHYVKKKKQRQYLSLIKVDLNYFFRQIYDKYQSDVAGQIRRAHKELSSEEIDALIKAKTDAALSDLKQMEEPAVEKTVEKK
jgi:hypothetical protein